MFPDSVDEDLINYENLRLKSAAEDLSVLRNIVTAIASAQLPDQVTSQIIKNCIKQQKRGVYLVIFSGD